MRVLLVSQYYNPEPSDVRIHELGRALAQRGHQVTAVTGFPNYPLGRIYDGYRQKLFQWETKEGVRVLRLPLYPSHTPSMARRAVTYLSYASSASLLGPLLAGRHDVLWAYQPPMTTGIAAWWMSRVLRIPYVYHIEDIWPDTAVSAGVASDGPAYRALGVTARRLYLAASCLSVQSPGFKRVLAQRGVRPDRIHVIPNFANEEIYRPVERDPALGEEHGLAGKFNVVFAGNLGNAQGLECVLKAAALLRHEPGIQFVLIGQGVSLPDLKAGVQELGLTNVRFIPFQPPSAMAGFFAWADVLLIHLRDDPLFAITVPAKTQSYLACGRPILCAVRGDAADIVQEAGAGCVCPPEDPEAMAAEVRRLYAMGPVERDAMGRRGRAAFLRGYTRGVVIDRTEALLRSLVEDRKRVERVMGP